MNDALAAQRAGLDPALPALPAALDPAVLDAVSGVGADAEVAGMPVLPGDHPAWQRDVLSISSRARALIAALRPIALKVFSFWDHRIREAVFGGRTLSIDPCGSYRLR